MTYANFYTFRYNVFQFENEWEKIKEMKIQRDGKMGLKSRSTGDREQSRGQAILCCRFNGIELLPDRESHLKQDTLIEATKEYLTNTVSGFEWKMHHARLGYKG